MSDENLSDESAQLIRETAHNGRHEPAELAMAFAIGAALGAGLAAICVPERRRSGLPKTVRRRYSRVRKTSYAAVDELRAAAREVAGDFREEIGATLEAGREELRETVRKQLIQKRRALRRENRQPRN